MSVCGLLYSLGLCIIVVIVTTKPKAIFKKRISVGKRKCSFDTTEPQPSTSAQLGEETKISSASKRKVGDVLSNYKEFREDDECRCFDNVDISGDVTRNLRS